MNISTTKLPVSYAQQLRAMGAVLYDLWLPETRALTKVLLKAEIVQGLVYGRYTHSEPSDFGRGVLVATSQRILLIDAKPLYTRCDEISYAVVSGVTYRRAAIAGTVILHTRLGDVSIRTYNHACARQFITAVESRLFVVNTD